ncbi:hypothetical protein BU17DRAFT_63684 [Hysterangium stoloniferum]|nr:hypothetical protein BU17DRAFT_63684 [Hysterangium stoloniferum]
MSNRRPDRSTSEYTSNKRIIAYISFGIAFVAITSHRKYNLHPHPHFRFSGVREFTVAYHVGHTLLQRSQPVTVVSALMALCYTKFKDVFKNRVVATGCRSIHRCRALVIFLVERGMGSSGDSLQEVNGNLAFTYSYGGMERKYLYSRRANNLATHRNMVAPERLRRRIGVYGERKKWHLSHTTETIPQGQLINIRHMVNYYPVKESNLSLLNFLANDKATVDDARRTRKKLPTESPFQLVNKLLEHPGTNPMISKLLHGCIK